MTTLIRLACVFIGVSFATHSQERSNAVSLLREATELTQADPDPDHVQRALSLMRIAKTYPRPIAEKTAIAGIINQLNGLKTTMLPSGHNAIGVCEGVVRSLTDSSGPKAAYELVKKPFTALMATNFDTLTSSEQVALATAFTLYAEDNPREAVLRAFQHFEDPWRNVLLMGALSSLSSIDIDDAIALTKRYMKGPLGELLPLMFRIGTISSESDKAKFLRSLEASLSRTEDDGGIVSQLKYTIMSSAADTFWRADERQASRMFESAIHKARTLDNVPSRLSGIAQGISKYNAPRSRSLFEEAVRRVRTAEGENPYSRFWSISAIAIHMKESGHPLASQLITEATNIYRTRALQLVVPPADRVAMLCTLAEYYRCYG